MKKEFRLSKDKDGFVDGIYYGKQLICYLVSGACINEHYSEWLVNILNGEQKEPPKKTLKL